MGFSSISVVNQFYTAEILKEYVIRGNTAILKCNIPSFVADYVTVDGWSLGDGEEFLAADNKNYGVYFGDAACVINVFFCFPSFQVRVFRKIIIRLYVHNGFFSVVTQYYVTEAENEYVIRGNAAVMKCKIPSFVADFVSVVAWVADDGSTYIHSPRDDTGNHPEELLTGFLFFV